MKFAASEVADLIGCPELENGSSSPDLLVVGEIAGAPFISNSDFFTIVGVPGGPPR